MIVKARYKLQGKTCGICQVLKIAMVVRKDICTTAEYLGVGDLGCRADSDSLFFGSYSTSLSKINPASILQGARILALGKSSNLQF